MTPDEILLQADKGQMEIALLRATGTGGACQIKLVAGARYANYLNVDLV